MGESRYLWVLAAAAAVARSLRQDGGRFGMSLGALIFLSLALGVAAWLFFLWTVRTGQYEDPEGPKYRMLEDDQDDHGRKDEGRGPAQGGTGDGAGGPRRGGA